jgi:hypothetical protein
MDSEVKRLLGEHEALKGKRQKLEGPWREIARLVLPSHDAFGSTPRPDVPDPFVYDDSGEEANRLHAAVLNYLLTPDGQEWHGLSPADSDLEDDPEIAEWCQAATRQLFKLRERGAFAAQAHEAFLSVGAFGPGSLYLEDRPGKGPRYEAVPLAELWFSPGPDGDKETVHRAYELPARAAAAIFPELPEKLQKIAEREPFRDLKFLHVVEPNGERRAGRLDAAGMRWASWHVSLEEPALLRRSGFRTMPYAIGRYLVAPGEVYGRSPGWSSLPTLSMLNTMARNRIIEANRRASPPLLAVDDDMMDPPLLAPDAVNHGWLTPDGKPRLWPMYFRSDPRAFAEVMGEGRERIERAFLVSLFLMLQERPQMTATEVLERAGEKGIVLAPIMGRLQSELLRPIIDRELDIAARMGLLPRPPAALVDAGGLKIEYTSPLARLVAADESRGILQTAEAAAMLANLDPTVGDRLDLDEGLQKIARGNRIPAAVLRDDKAVAAIAKQRADAANAQQALAAAPVAADALKSLRDAGAAA